jgi:hypothetical protein
MKIFIGSSSQALDHAEDVYVILKELAQESGAQVQPTLWNAPGLFAPGDTIIETIEKVGREFQAAVLLATPDDKTVKRNSERWEPRDNIVFEAGYFMARFGRGHAAIVRVGEASLPSDINGLIYLSAERPERDPLTRAYDRSEFRLQLKDDLRPWLAHLMNDARPAGEPVDVKASTQLVRTWERLKSQHAWAGDYEAIACEVLEQMADSLEPGDSHNQGINHALINKLSETFLARADAISAIDVLGPPGWLSPISFRYLAVQIKEYIRRNLASDRWNLRFSPRLAAAIRGAVSQCDGGSLTMFDESDRGREDHSGRRVFWAEGTPSLEFCRVLLWSNEELLTPVAESVIAIHEAFHVPLFFVETPRQCRERDVDYIYFGRDGRMLDGFYGLRKRDYATESFAAGTPIPGISDPAAHYTSILAKKPEFAADARERLRHRTHRPI